MAIILMYAKVHSRDIFLANSEQCYQWTSTDAETVAVRSVNVLPTLYEETNVRIILHCMYICLTAPNSTHIKLVFAPLTLSAKDLKLRGMLQKF